MEIITTYIFLIGHEYYSLVAHWLKYTLAKLLLSVGRFCSHSSRLMHNLVTSTPGMPLFGTGTLALNILIKSFIHS